MCVCACARNKFHFERFAPFRSKIMYLLHAVGGLTVPHSTLVVVVVVSNLLSLIDVCVFESFSGVPLESLRAPHRGEGAA